MSGARHRRWRVTATAGVVAVVGLVACGGAGGDQDAKPVPRGQNSPGTAETPGSGSSAIPDVDVVEVTSGEEFALGGLVPSDRPVLVWFWAPH